MGKLVEKYTKEARKFIPKGDVDGYVYAALEKEWEKKWGPSPLGYGWWIDIPETIPVLERCLEKYDPTELRELAETVWAGYEGKLT